MPLPTPITKESNYSSSGPNNNFDGSVPTRAAQMTRRLSRSPGALARIRVKNRRKRYLDIHPEYFTSPALELAGPLL